MPRATSTSPHARRDDHGACCPQDLRPLWREPPDLAAGPDTLVLPRVLASLAPPPAGGSRPVTGRRCGRPGGMVRGESPLYLGAKYPCTLGRNTLVPWGEIPLYLGAKYPCT